MFDINEVSKEMEEAYKRDIRAAYKAGAKDVLSGLEIQAAVLDEVENTYEYIVGAKKGRETALEELLEKVREWNRNSDKLIPYSAICEIVRELSNYDTVDEIMRREG